MATFLVHVHGMGNSKLQAAHVVRWVREGCGVEDMEFAAFLCQLGSCEKTLTTKCPSLLEDCFEFVADNNNLTVAVFNMSAAPSNTCAPMLACSSNQSRPRTNADDDAHGRAAKRRKTLEWMEIQSDGRTPALGSFIGDMKKAMGNTLQKDERFASFCEIASWQKLQGHAPIEAASAAPKKHQEKVIDSVARWVSSASASSIVESLTSAQSAVLIPAIMQALSAAITERIEATEGDRIKNVVEVERTAAGARVLEECAKLREVYEERELLLRQELAKAQSKHKQLQDSHQKAIDVMRAAVIAAVNGNFVGICGWEYGA